MVGLTSSKISYSSKNIFLTFIGALVLFFGGLASAGPAQAVDSPPSIDDPVCGNIKCEDGENWETCGIDCGKPYSVSDAQKAISEAEKEVKEGDKGYETLKEAKKEFENDNYVRAERLADKAARENSGEITLYLAPLVLTLTSLLFLGAVINLGKRKLMKRKSSQKSELSRRVAQVKRELRKAESGDFSPGTVKSNISIVETHIENESYDRAEELLNGIEALLSVNDSEDRPGNGSGDA